MGEGVVIRSFEVGELPAVAARFPEVRLREQDAAAHQRGELTIAVAWLSVLPVGIGMVHWLGPRVPSLAELLPDCPELCRLMVNEDCQRKGIGTLIVRFLENCAMEGGFAHLGLGVGLGNDAAYNFYIQLGYSRANVPTYMDPGEDGVVGEECRFLIKSW